MKSRGKLIIVAAAAACLAAPLTTATAFASPTTAGATANTPLPAHVYAPYYETYLAPNTASITATAKNSTARYFTLAFLQAAGKGSCSLNWNSNSSQPLSYYNSDITSLRALGGNVIPSFGGYGADSTGTEIADSCTNVGQIAADYEKVITTLGVTRLDMDVEANSLNNSAGIKRRNQAIAMTETWAAARHIPLQIQYTLPVEQYGLDPNGVNVLKSAVANHATVSSVNIMVFDYYAGSGTVNMGQAAINSARSTHTQLAKIFTSRTSAQIWNMEAMTFLPGIDDNPAKTEITSLANAKTLMSFASSKGMNLLSSWAIQRDNGGCPGTPDSNTCSGISQSTWAFTHLLKPFTS
jgi:hypothetical protein